MTDMKKKTNAAVATLARKAGQQWMEEVGAPSDCSDAELAEQAGLMAEFYGADRQAYAEAFIAGALSMCV